MLHHSNLIHLLHCHFNQINLYEKESIIYHNIDEKLTEEEIQKFKELAKKYEVEDKELNHI